MKALVTGGAGFIGSHLVRALLAQGAEVTAVDDLSAGKLQNLPDDPRLELVVADVRHECMYAWCHGVDVVFHNAGSRTTVVQAAPIHDLTTNAVGTLNMLQAAVAAGVKRFIHASSGSVYGTPIEVPQREEHRLYPCGFYGTSKLAAETYVRLHADKLQTTILRYYHVYGPRQDESETGGVVAIFMRNARENQPFVIHGSGKQVRNFTWVGDIVRANMLALGDTRMYSGVYNVVSDVQMEIWYLASTIAKIHGVPYTPKMAPRRPQDIDLFRASNQRIRGLGMTFDNDMKTRLMEMAHGNDLDRHAHNE